MRTAIFSVVYPGVEEYLKDFFLSLEGQDDEDFEIYIVNDGLRDLLQWTSKLRPAVHIKEIGISGLTPAKIRKIGIEWLAGEDIECVIFADSDDYFSTNRVRICKEILKENRSYRAVVNDLIFVKDGSVQTPSMLGGRFLNGQQITEESIKHANCCGLSNAAAYVCDLVKIIDQIPDQIIAFDWQLFARLLISGGEIIYTNQTVTYYRQHGNNIASPYLISEQLIVQGINIKLAHYLALQQVDLWYSEKVTQYKNLLMYLESDPLIKKAYIKCTIESAPENPLWWEMIKPLEELPL